MTETPRQGPPAGGGRLIGRVRKERIAQLIRERGFMSSAALATLFGVSEMTVRRDLAELDLRGVIQRTHGGAVIDPSPEGEADAAAEPFFDERNVQNRDAKTAIAQAAAALAGPAQAVVLDVGTTTYALAKILTQDERLRIFTNNLRISALGTAAGAEVHTLGGRVRPSEMSLYGPMAIEQARRLWFDVAFIGVSAISEMGIYDYALEEAEMKRVFAERATKRVVVADSSKFGARSLVEVAPLDRFEILVTERTPPSGIAEALEQAGVQVIVAGA